MHTARFRDGLASPGGAPGYDENKGFGNFIAHSALGLPKGCAEHSDQTWKVKAGPLIAFIQSLAGFAGLGEHFHRHSGMRAKYADPD
jgi:hypothetical protein